MGYKWIVSSYHWVLFLCAWTKGYWQVMALCFSRSEDRGDKKGLVQMGRIFLCVWTEGYW